jgi:hypothetical protein
LRQRIPRGGGYVRRRNDLLVNPKGPTHTRPKPKQSDVIDDRPALCGVESRRAGAARHDHVGRRALFGGCPVTGGLRPSRADLRSRRGRGRETRAQRSRETCAQRSRETRAQRSRETRAQRSRETRAQRSRETRAQRSRETRAQRWHVGRDLRLRTQV